MKRVLLCLTLFAVAASAATISVAGAPADVSKAVGAEELATAARTKAEDLGKVVASEAAYSRAMENKIIAKDARARTSAVGAWRGVAVQCVVRHAARHGAR